MHKSLFKIWPLLIILLLTFILRTIRLEELFYFTYDESVFAFVGRRLILWHHVPLIGGVTPFGAHVAPYFYWFFALTLGIGNLNPLVWGWVSAVISVLTVGMIYKFGAVIENKRLGFIAATIWTFSLLTNIYDRHFWGLTFGPLFSIIILFCLYKIIKGREKFIYPLGLSLALIIHADLSYYIFILLTMIVWIIYKLPLKKSTVIGISFILLSFAPLIVFDLRHNFSNTKPLINFVDSNQNKVGINPQKLKDNIALFPKTTYRFLYVSGDNEISKQYSYSQVFAREKLKAIPTSTVLLLSLALIFFTYWSFLKNENPGWQLISILSLLYFLGIQIYGTLFNADIFEHYLSGMFSALILIIAFFLYRLPKLIFLFALTIFISTNLYKFSLTQNSQGLLNKRLAVEYSIKQVEEKHFSLDSLSTRWKYNGYRYLFSAYGKEPVKSYVDPNFTYLYGTTEVADSHPQTVVVFVTHDSLPETDGFYKRYALLKSHEISSALFGSLEVIIIDNSSGWFDKNDSTSS